MEGWDDGPRVRPISLDDDLTTAGVESSVRPDRHQRQWLPVVVTSIAVVVIVVVVSLFGALESDDPQQDTALFSSVRSDTSNDQRLTDSAAASIERQPRLGVSDTMTLIATYGDRVRTLLWDPSFGVPRPYNLLDTAMITESDLVSASFDSSGTSLAVLVDTPAGTNVWAGTPTNVGESPDIVAASSSVWHATRARSIAWIGEHEGGNTVLATGSIHRRSGSLVNVRPMAELTPSAQILRWDEDGFIINEAGAIRALAADGTLRWERAGIAMSSSSSFVIATAPNDGSVDVLWMILDRSTGERAGPSPDLVTEEAWVPRSRDPGLIATVAASDTHSILTVRGKNLRSPRTVEIEQQVSPIGFTSKSDYFLFNALDTSDLVFVNWRTGATHTVQIPSEYAVVGLELG
ncbi:MAG: hypothetical protein M3132_09170 [Actinomycetia bacterium]|nr:hypothetical protein [Actinomycetes bacterium]